MKFKTRDGTTVADGDEVELVLMYDTDEVVKAGTVRHFEQVDRVYDDEGIAVGKTTTKHWELVHSDPDNPQITAIGFLPENVARVNTAE